MNISEFCQMNSSSMAEDTLLSKSYSDYYESIYNRAIARVERIIDNHELVEDNGYKMIFETIDGAKLFRESDLKNAFKDFNALVESEGIDKSVYTITLQDVEDSKLYTFDISELARQMGDQVDTCFLTWKSFESLDSNVSNAQEFLNRIQNGVSDVTNNLRAGINAVYSILSDTVSNAKSKLSNLLTFVGLGKLMNNGNFDSETDLSNYTGANPFTSWLLGLDWSVLVNPFADALNRTAVLAVLTANVIKNLAVSTWNGITWFLFDFIGAKFSKTFIDPVDYEVKGDAISYFTTPSKFCFSIDDRDGVPTNVWEPFIQSLGGGTWFSKGPVLYHCIGFAPDSSNRIFFERYVRPVDVYKLDEILSQFMAIDNTGEVIINNVFNVNHSFFDYGTFSLICDTLSNADLSCSAEDPEIDVYYGLCASLYLSQLSQYLNMGLSSAYMNTQHDDIKGYYPDFNKGVDELKITDEVIQSGLMNGLAFSSLNGFWKDLFYFLECYVGKHTASALEGRHTCYFGVTPIMDFGDIKNHVDNSDFIKILTTHNYVDYSNANNVSSINAYTATNVVNSYMCLDNLSSGISIDPYFSNIHNDWMFSDGLNIIGNVQYAGRILNSGTDFDGAFIPYTHSNFKLSANATILTDAQHAESITKFLKGIAIGVITVAVSIAAITTTIKIVDWVRKVNFTRDTLAFNYGDAIANGNTEEATKLYKQWNGYNVKACLVNAAFGSTTKLFSTGSLADYTSNRDNNSRVISLLSDVHPV